MASTNSTLYYFLDDLVTQLQSITLNSVTVIKHINLYHGQDDRPENEQSFDRPAVLIEFEDIDWHTTKHTAGGGTTNRKHEKSGTLTFNLHILLYMFNKELSRFNDIDEIRQLIDKSIEGMSNPDRAYNPVKKIREAQQVNDSAEWKWVITYTVPLEEEGVSRGLVGKTGVSPNITGTISAT